MKESYSKLIIEEFILSDKDCKILPSMWDWEMVEHFIIYGGPRPFTAKSLDTLSDVDINGSRTRGHVPPNTLRLGKRITGGPVLLSWSISSAGAREYT
jgi:hypothetical protein